MTIRGEPAFGRGSIAPQPCIRRVQGPEPLCSHSHRQRSSEAEDPFFQSARKPRGTAGIPPPRTVIGSHHKRTDKAETVAVPFNVLRSLCRTQNDAVWHHALPHELPQGDQKLARQGHDHGFASAAGVLGAGSKPMRQGAVLLVHKEPPRQLDHAAPNSTIAGTGQPFLPAFPAALVGRASEARITGYGPSVAHVSRQHLVYQHVSRLNADPDHTHQQAHHSVRSITGRVIKTLQACLLNLPDLIPNEPSPLHVATQLSQRVRWYWLAPGRASIFKAPGRPFQFGIEAADAEPD